MRMPHILPTLSRRRFHDFRLAALPRTLLMALVVALVCCRGSALLSAPEFGLLDTWLRTRPPRQPDAAIALIGVDADLLAQFKRHKDELGRLSRLGGPNTCTCATIGRDVLADTVQRVKGARAKVTALDFYFDLPCTVHDRALLAALALPGYTVLVSQSDPTPGRFNFTEMPSFLALPQPPLVASPVLNNPRGVIRSVRLVQEEAAEEDTTALAAQPLAVRRVRPPLAVACYMAYRDHPDELPETGGSAPEVRCLDTSVPVLCSEHVLLLGALAGRSGHASKNAMLISWAGNIGTFPMYSLKAVRAASPQQLQEWFRGKIVLIGSTADRQLAPLGQPAVACTAPLIDQRLPADATAAAQETSALCAMSGLEIHANVLDTLLQQRFIRPLPTPAVWLLVLLVSWLTILVFERRAIGQAIAITIIEMGVIVVAAAYLIRADYWLFAFIPAVAIWISAVTGAVSGYSRARHTAQGLAQHIEARDAATTTLVHDLKQPLGAIKMLAQILRKQQQEGKQPPPEVIEHIQEQVQIALGDIDELLAIDPHRKIPLQVRPFDLCALARDLAVTQSLKSSGHEVQVQGPADGLVVEGDPRYLGRALSNLMDNAIKYWPDGGTVVVEIRREPGQAEVRVIDHGLGIAPEAQARLFKRFERAVPAGNDIPGTGIGLFSVKRIAEAHGGTVRLISTPGEGSTFIMALPLPR